MADEQNKIDNKQESAALSEIELKASEKGWVPQKEWEGDPDSWRPAREFLDRGELMDRISSQTKQINQYDTKLSNLEKHLKQLTEHNKKVAKMEYEKALADLKKQKASALDYGNHTAVVELDEKMSDLKQSQQSIEALEMEQELQAPMVQHPEVTNWVNNNNWFNTDIALRGAAEALAQQYLSNNPSAETNPGAVLSYVSEQIQKEFPEKFGVKQQRPSGVSDPNMSSNSGQKGTKKRWTKSHLNDMQREFMNAICDDEFTEQDYINQLGELGELS